VSCPQKETEQLGYIMGYIYNGPEDYPATNISFSSLLKENFPMTQAQKKATNEFLDTWE